MKIIHITKETANKAQLPAKAISSWGVIKETEDSYRLRRLRVSDGEYAADNPNNYITLQKAALDKVFKVESPAKAEPKKDVSEVPNTGTRKARWIAQLLKNFEEDPFLSKLLDDVDLLTKKILEDTDASKGKKYSSISGALRVWNIRIRNGEV